MALKLEEIRALADRVARSHGLEVVDVEYQGGGGKHRTLRVFIEKNEAERAKLRERVERLQAERENGQEGAADEAGLDGKDDLDEEGSDLEPGYETDESADEGSGENAGYDGNSEKDEAFLAGLPSVANLEFLSGITHGDCEVFSRDFGTVLDVEELGPGTEYLLEVSSPGLDRRLAREEDYRRFKGSLVKLQTFDAVAGSRHWQGRIAAIEGETILLDLGGKETRKRPKKGTPAAPASVEIALSNVEKAHLVPDF